MKNNQNILSSVLLASALTLTPLAVTTLSAKTQVKVNSLSNSIAKNLHRRGIDKDISIKIAGRAFRIDEELFALMLQNVENGCSTLSKNEILDYLSTQALMQKNIELDSYSYLVNMMHNIKGEALSKDELNNLNLLAAKNSFYVQGWF